MGAADDGRPFIHGGDEGSEPSGQAPEGEKPPPSATSAKEGTSDGPVAKTPGARRVSVYSRVLDRVGDMSPKKAWAALKIIARACDEMATLFGLQ
jgi:hypothetical protein